MSLSLVPNAGIFISSKMLYTMFNHSFCGLQLNMIINHPTIFFQLDFLGNFINFQLAWEIFSLSSWSAKIVPTTSFWTFLKHLVVQCLNLWGPTDHPNTEQGFGTTRSYYAPASEIRHWWRLCNKTCSASQPFTTLPTSGETEIICQNDVWWALFGCS